MQCKASKVDAARLHDNDAHDNDEARMSLSRDRLSTGEAWSRRVSAQMTQQQKSEPNRFQSLQHDFLAPCGCSSSQSEMNARRIPQEADSRRNPDDWPHVRRPVDTPFLGREPVDAASRIKSFYMVREGR